MLSKDYYVFRSTVIALNNFVQYSHCQVVQPFRSPFLIKALTSFFKENVRYPLWTCRDPITIFADSRDTIFNSRDPNRVPKTP